LHVPRSFEGKTTVDQGHGEILLGPLSSLALPVIKKMGGFGTGQLLDFSPSAGHHSIIWGRNNGTKKNDKPPFQCRM